MTQAKAIINLATGTVELEGPVDFVREYLEKYSPSNNIIRINGPEIVKRPYKKRTVSKTIAKAMVLKEKVVKEKPAKLKAIKPVKILTRNKRGRNSLAKIIDTEIAHGLFDSPISMKAINEAIENEWIRVSGGMLKGALKKAMSDGTIESVGKGRGMGYVRKASNPE